MFFPFHPTNLEAIVSHYEREGFVILTEVDERPARALRQIISSLMGLIPEQIQKVGRDEILTLSMDQRTALARPVVTSELQNICLDVFGELLVRLLGPIIHVSQSFHPQVKNLAMEQTILNGYSGNGLEVQAVYGFHQDFTAARVLTSPNAVVCWIPLNTCEANTLRVYPRSHRLGLLTNRWLPRDTVGMDRLGRYIDVQAKEGQVLFFNFQTMHGGSNPGQGTRISCDLRFFPLCGIIDSAPMILRPDPVRWIQERTQQLSQDTLLAPLFETLAYCGLPVISSRPQRYSSLYWAHFVNSLVRRDIAQGLEGTAHWVNTEIGFDPVSAYQQRFAEVRLCERSYASIQHVVPEAQRILELMSSSAAS